MQALLVVELKIKAAPQLWLRPPAPPHHPDRGRLGTFTPPSSLRPHQQHLKVVYFPTEAVGDSELMVYVCPTTRL